MGKRETKRHLIAAIRRAQAGGAFGAASVEFLSGKSIAELRETLGRCNAIEQVTQREIDRHCDTSFIK